MKKSISRQAKARFDQQLRHRINAGRFAVNAQRAFFKRQFGQVASEWKDDDTRVTFADFAISENLSNALRRDFAEDVFCSEEANPQDEILGVDSEFAWVADPIDGTNNYALGFPICAISLALLYNGRPVYGFIYDHGVDSLIEGGPGFGLLINQKRRKLPQADINSQAILGLHFPIEESLLKQLNPLLMKYRVRCVGSGALSAVYVATGYLKGVVDFKVKVWDIAAAYAICAGVGIDYEFLGECPFPLRKFHARLPFCPYFMGVEPLSKELNVYLRA